MDAKIHGGILCDAAPGMGEGTLVIADPTNVQKEYAERLPYLAKVWDGSKGIFVYDRGGDGDDMFGFYIRHGLDFIVRLAGDRYLLNWGGKTERSRVLARDLAAGCSGGSSCVTAGGADGTARARKAATCRWSSNS